MTEQKTPQETEEIFKSFIAIPKNIPDKQFFFCPVGFVGTGKTTVAKPISDRFGLLRISSDELRKILKENNLDFSPLKEIILKIAKEFAERGYSISFDMDCGNPETKTAIEELAKKLDAKIVWVHVDTPEDYVINGFINDAQYRSWLTNDPQKMIDNYHEQKERRAKENTHFDFLCTFDTSSPGLGRQINECCEKINKYLIN